MLETGAEGSERTGNNTVMESVYLLRDAGVCEPYLQH